MENYDFLADILREPTAQDIAAELEWQQEKAAFLAKKKEEEEEERRSLKSLGWHGPYCCYRDNG